MAAYIPKIIGKRYILPISIIGVMSLSVFIYYSKIQTKFELLTEHKASHEMRVLVLNNAIDELTLYEPTYKNWVSYFQNNSLLDRTSKQLRAVADTFQADDLIMERELPSKDINLSKLKKHKLELQGQNITLNAYYEPAISLYLNIETPHPNLLQSLSIKPSAAALNTAPGIKPKPPLQIESTHLHWEKGPTPWNLKTLIINTNR